MKSVRHTRSTTSPVAVCNRLPVTTGIFILLTMLCVTGCKRASDSGADGSKGSNSEATPAELATKMTAALGEEKFQEVARLAAAWTAADSSDSRARLVSSLGYYFNGSYSAFVEEREKLPTSEAAIKQLAEFAGQLPEQPGKGIKAFVRGVVAELKGNLPQAREAYMEAARQDQGQILYRYNAEAAREGAAWQARIPQDHALTYMGTMTCSSIGNWIPAENSFNVSGGNLETTVGECKHVASFGGWDHIETQDGMRIGWAARLVKGDAIVPAPLTASSISPPEKNQYDGIVKIEFKPSPFDFGNRYCLIHIGGVDSPGLPVILKPFAAHSPEFVVGKAARLAKSDLLPPASMGLGSIIAIAENSNSPATGLSADTQVGGDTFKVSEIATVYHQIGDQAAMGGLRVTDDGFNTFFGQDLRRNVVLGSLHGEIKGQPR